MYFACFVFGIQPKLICLFISSYLRNFVYESMTISYQQGRIHGNLCRGRLSRGSNELGRSSNNQNCCPTNLQIARKCKKKKYSGTDRATDRRTNRPTDRPTDTGTYRSRCPRQKRCFNLQLCVVHVTVQCKNTAKALQP